MSCRACQNLLVFLGSINEDQAVPHKKKISKACLDVKNILEKTLKDLLKKENFDSFCLSLDLWTDNSCFKNPFMNINIHYVDNNWVLQKFLLTTSFLSRPHTGVRIASAIKKVLEQFELTEKICWAVSDRGANVTLALSNLGMETFDCLLHGLHNLITRDLMGHADMRPVVKVLAKIKII